MNIKHTIPILTIVLCLLSCAKDRSYEYYEKTEKNTWIFRQMQDVYLWNDQIQEPGQKDFFGEQSKFFSSLIKGSNSSDKWSYITVDSLNEDPHQRNYYHHSNSYGLELVLMNDPTSTTSRQFARVMNVLKGSPAADSGLQRGDFISMVDSQRVSSTILEKYLVSGKGRQLTVHHLDNDTTSYFWQDTLSIDISASRYVEDDAFPAVSIIRDYQSAKKIGYLMCTRLIETPEGEPSTTSYLDKLDQIMKAFHDASIDELVVDFRLCNYGSIDMAARLASYVAPSSSLGTTFLSTIFNSNHSSENTSYPLLSDLSAYNLNLSRVCVITSTITQGAPEWFIQGLRAITGEDNVIIVGAKTMGQNILTRFSGANYGVQLYPAVANISDSQGVTDFSQFTPYSQTLTLNDVNVFNISNYGSYDEPLLYYAIEHLTGRDVKSEE